MKKLFALAIVSLGLFQGCAHPGPGLPPCKGNGDPSDNPGVNCRIVFTQTPTPEKK